MITTSLGSFSGSSGKKAAGGCTCVRAFGYTGNITVHTHYLPYTVHVCECVC